LFLLILLLVDFVENQMAVGNFDLQTLQCWRCEPKECHRHFDFTQHRMESCDGKCWKSFEVIETKTKEDREKAEETPALRQCFSSEDLTKASTIGLNTANGCRDVKMREKIKKFCFCDSNMCNGTKKLYSSVVFVVNFRNVMNKFSVRTVISTVSRSTIVSK
ncbi:unnamed protein product, partial [Didymodactylos carnosus]